MVAASPRVHVHVCTRTHPLWGSEHSSHLRVISKEPSVACSHVRMKNELGRRGQPGGSVAARLSAGSLARKSLCGCRDAEDAVRGQRKGARACSYRERKERDLFLQLPSGLSLGRGPSVILAKSPPPPQDVLYLLLPVPRDRGPCLFPALARHSYFLDFGQFLFARARWPRDRKQVKFR